MKIIGLAGTNGAGKDTLGEILAKYHGFIFITVSDFLREEAKKRGLKPEREPLRQISAEWRRKKGLGVLVDMAVDEFKKTGKKFNGLVVGSLRNSGEAEAVKKAGGIMVWVDADPKIRYQRVASRQRDKESQMAYEEFLKDEKVEMQHRGDEATLSLSKVKAQADIFIENNSTLDDFRQKIEKALGLA